MRHTRPFAASLLLALSCALVPSAPRAAAPRPAPAAAPAPAPAAPQLTTPSGCGGANCIQVGTFNIEWLGTHDMHPPRSATVLRQLAEFVADTLDLEVVVFEEVNAASNDYARFRSALEQRGYRLHAGESGGTQNVIIAYDDEEVDLLGDVRELDVRADFQLPNNCRSRGLRRPLAGHFRAGRFDFLLVGVHLKAQPGGACSDRVRRAQADDIRGALPQLMQQSNEDDVIIAGDFNAEADDPSLNPLDNPPGTADDFTILTDGPLRANGSALISYLEAPFEGVIDHLLIKRGPTREWVERSTFIFNPPSGGTARARYLANFSDHAPVWSWFRTDADLDN